MIVLILLAPALWNLSQHLTSFWTVIIIIQCNQHYLRIYSVDKNLFKLSDNELTLILLYGSTQYSLMNNHILINSSIKYIENS